MTASLAASRLPARVAALLCLSQPVPKPPQIAMNVVVARQIRVSRLVVI
jgi:hypothetical protein